MSYEEINVWLFIIIQPGLIIFFFVNSIRWKKNISIFCETEKIFRYKYHMRIIGTKFQEMLWNNIKRILRGKTSTYKQIVMNIYRSLACQVVSYACTNNPYPILNVCQRIIRTNGNLSRYISKKSDIKKLLCEEV